MPAPGAGHLSIARLVELIERRRPCVVLTGAGISTESGIPDFRSASGIWAQYDPLEVATIEAFHANPAKVWEFYAARLDALGDAEPNDGHRALAELEKRGWVDAVVTQNVDRLHTRAGSQRVIEVHGTIGAARCLDCGTVVPSRDLSLPVPDCPECGRVLKPDVVLFGELLPETAVAAAVDLAAHAGVLLVVGSSLEVYPIAGLPLETIAAGGELAIVNRGATPFDSRAAVTIDAGAGETLRALADALPQRL
ncbi:MAG TPA: NAD-dependent deacylase [Gaiellaceae bacterium]|nr:NAD-dependent deacylase [Gaiellaceae bacterium]